MKRRRLLRRALAVATASAVWAPAAASAADGIDYAAIRATKVIRAVRTDQPIVLDGRLDEPAWQRAAVAKDFLQQEPAEGAPATEASEVRFLYDDEALYVGGRFVDSDPRGGIVNELKRDYALYDSDSVAIVLDTFNKKLDNYAFMVNPAGAQRDAENYDDGRQVNVSWDGAWSVKTARFEGGWTMEMKIPFRSLRFERSDDQAWGLNVMRMVRRKNETSYWSPQPRQFRAFKPSYAGQLTGLEGLHPGLNLRIKPFYTGRYANATLPGLSRRGDGDGGVDVKYGVASALALDLTYRTDFSQVEVDEQQINLTRFSLFFPEKRDFFLENQGTFRIGDQDSGGQSAGRRDFLPFFSRRIGLSSTGDPVPIVGGVRLTGRQGKTSLGIVDMQTGSFNDRPGENVLATRIGRDFGPAMVSGFYLGRESSGNAGSNRVAGSEMRLKFRHTIDVNGFVMGSTTTGGPSGTAARAAFNVSESLYSAQVSYTNISANFRDDLGFIPRGDVGLTAWDAAKYIRWQKGLLRSVSFGGSGEVFDTSAHDLLVSRHLRAYSVQTYSDGGTLEVDADSNYERLTKPFQVSKGVVLPVGEYRFKQVLPTFTSNKSGRISGVLGYTGGEFYSGDIRGVTTGLRIRVDEHLATSATYAHNAVTLPQGSFTTDLAGFRADCSFSTKMFLNAFVQYNSAAKTWLTNVRYRLIYRPLSDFYIVYNDTRVAGAIPQRTIALKHTLLLSF